MAVAKPKKPSELPGGTAPLPPGILYTERQILPEEIEQLRLIVQGEAAILPVGFKWFPAGIESLGERCAYCGTRVIGTVVKCQGCGAPV